MKGFKINENIVEKLNEGIVAIACSGGSDSMALLHYAQNNLTNFYVINFEHGIRGESSVSDSNFVKEYCKNNAIKIDLVKLDTMGEKLKTGLTTEEQARKLRYEYFDKVLKSKQADYIALAHHKQDQVETVLMRIFRGTGIDGLGGIKQINGGIIRPLLDVSKEEIMQYISENNIPYVEDETNSDTAYTRNFIRHELLPIIKKRYPKAEDSIVRLASIASETSEYFDGLATAEKLDKNTVGIDITTSLEVLRKSVKKAYSLIGINQDIEHRHYELIEKLSKLENGKSLQMPYNTTAYKEYDKIVIEKNILEEDFEILLQNELKVPKLTDKVAFSKVSGNFSVKDGLYFDMDKMPKDAVIRHRKDGDIFTKFGGGSKNLGDYLTDKKVPLRLRDKVVVIASNNDVLLIAGYAISDKVKLNDKSQNIYKITTEKDNGI